MITKRMFSTTALGLIATGAPRRAVRAQSTGQQSQAELPRRGTPTGRVGGAGRDGETDQTLELVAPQVGIGLSSSDQPTLCYLLSGPVGGPLRLVISLPNRARPIADVALQPPGKSARIGVVHLRDYKIRLAANELYIWSVAMLIDPQAPSHDLVASALIRYRPQEPALRGDINQAVVQRDYTRLAANGYWYDAVALAEENHFRDGGAGLAQILKVLHLKA
jgi:hypothetical protein